MVDSFGALAHVQDHSYMDMYLEEQKAEKKIPPAPIQEAPQGPNTHTPDGNSGLSADELLWFIALKTFTCTIFKETHPDCLLPVAKHYHNIPG